MKKFIKRYTKKNNTIIPDDYFCIDKDMMYENGVPYDGVQEVCLLHDVIEDTHYTYEDIKVKFGERVADFVSQESDEVYPDLPKEESWKIRKTHALARLKSSSKETKIIALGDKLSNMRAIYRDHKAEGESFWNRFNVKDPLEQEWYYRGLKDSLSELNYTEAYKEFAELLEKVFNK